MHIGVLIHRRTIAYIGMQWCQKSPRYVLHVIKVQLIKCGIENYKMDIYIRHQCFPFVIVHFNCIIAASKRFELFCHGVMVTDVMRQQRDVSRMASL